MKRRIVSILCMTALTAMTLAGCGGGAAKSEAPAPAAEADKEAAPEADAQEAEAAPDESERTSLIVGFDAEFPPYGYVNESGGYEGFDLDMAAAVCEMKGWEFVPQPIDWDVKDMELNSGQIDCIWNGFTINGREDAYTWSVPYIDNSQVFVVPSDAGIASQADLAGKQVGVQKDSSALSALNDEESPENIALRDSFANLIEYSDYNSAFMDLEAGAIEAIAIDIGVANYQLSQRGDAFMMLDEPLATEQYGIGFKLGNESLRDEVEACVLELFANGKMEEIAANYDIDPTMICLN